MDAERNLELARRVYPNDENLRVAYMLGLERGCDTCKRSGRDCVKLNVGSGVDKNTLKVDSPRFKVVSVKRVIGCNKYLVAEYLATSWYRTKKDVSSLTIIFYDEIGKYNIGDELELFKK